MVQTVLLDVPTNVFIGHLMALSAHRQIRVATGPMNRCFWRAMGYSVFVFVPVAGTFYYAYPDWSWAYLLRPQELPWWVGPLVLSTYVAGMFHGYLTAQSLIARGLMRQAIASGLYSLAVVLGIFGFTWHQYLHLADHATYHSGTAVKIFQNARFMTTINAGGVLMVLGAAVVLGWNFLEGRKADRQQGPD